MRRSVLTLGVAVTVTAAIPLGLTACAGGPASKLQTTELAAAVDSGLLDSPIEHIYKFSELRVTEVGADNSAPDEAPDADVADATQATAATITNTPEATPQATAEAQPEGAATKLHSLVDSTDPDTTTSGYLALSDGVITAAELRVSFEQRLDATFIMTSPTVLRRDDSEDAEVYADGVLQIDGTEITDSVLRLVPRHFNDRGAEFDVTFELPDELLTQNPELPSEVSAHLVFTSEPEDAPDPGNTTEAASNE